jgi:hypothetical protein
MARLPTDTIRFLTLEELARLFAVVRASPRNRALFGVNPTLILVANWWKALNTVISRCPSQRKTSIL